MTRLQHSSPGRLDPFSETLLDSLADGVLAIGADRSIEVLNAQGADILGYQASALIGGTLAEAFLHTADNDAFLDAILAAGAGQDGTVRSVVSFERSDGKRQLAVASTAYRIPTGAHAGRSGVVVTFSDVTETLQLRDAERALRSRLEVEHADLQAAYVKIESLARREQQMSRRLGLIRTAAVLIVFGALSSVGIYNWQTSTSFASGTQDAQAGGTETVTATVQPIVSRLSVVGSIEPGAIVSVVSPFDGPIRRKTFEYGGAVRRGQSLVVLDILALELRRREAEGVMIKARQNLDEMRSWERGVEVSRARRTLVAAETEGTNLAVRAKQTKALLAKGIVAAEEYNQLVQQQMAQASQIESAKQDLSVVLKRGSEENQRIAEYELLNAEAKIDEIQRDIGNATVLAPVTGVVLQPKEGDAKQSGEVGVGSSLSRGQTIVTIGDLEGLLIRARIDEIDVNRLRIGQQAVVTGDAFEGLTLSGTVTSVSAQAAGEQATRGTMAVFPITVGLSALTDEQRARIHVGMSATVTVTVYDNPNAIVIPPSAIRLEADARVVTVVRDGLSQTVPVTLGISTPDGIEVRNGLEAGDVVEFNR